MSDDEDSDLPRLTDEEIDNLMRHYPDGDETARERTREFLKSELGSKYVDALGRQRESEHALRIHVAEIKANMLGATSRIDFVYVLIGEFIVKFSQIEFWLRFAFYWLTKLKPNLADPILAHLDIRGLIGGCHAIIRAGICQGPGPMEACPQYLFAMFST
jgi:hypothetical protein